MRFRKRQPEAPRGARIVHEDGSVTECALILDPDQDADGNAMWLVVPPAGFTLAPGDSFGVDYLPAHTGVAFECDVQ